MRSIIAIAIVSLFSVSAYGNQAVLEGTSLSLMLDDGFIDAGDDTLEMLFTTYDGDLEALPLYFDEQTLTIYYSKELKKVDASYKTDFYVLDNNELIDDGEMHLDLGDIDQDGNGIDDICEKDKAFNEAISGHWYSWGGSNGNISGTMVRNAGTQVGDYNLTLDDTLIGNVPVTGKFYAGTLAGSITYSSLDNSVSLEYHTTFEESSSTHSIATTYEIIDENQIQVNAVESLFPTTIFHRDGNTYAAEVTLPDGEDGTFWPDYQNWHIRIVDPNDSDGDGIPDLSDKRANKSVLTFLPLLLN